MAFYPICSLYLQFEVEKSNLPAITQQIVLMKEQWLKWFLNEKENADNSFPHLSLWVLRAVGIHTCAPVHAAVPHRNGSSHFLRFKALINHTQGEGGVCRQWEISKDWAFRFSKLSSLETVMTQLENAKCAPYLLLTTDRSETVIITLPIHGHFQAFVTSHWSS